MVCPGTYKGSASLSVKSKAGTITISSGALIATRIHLYGMPGAVIDATGLINAVTLFGPGAAGASVRGFTAENAIGEGILAAGTVGVTIADNTVIHNDNGTPKSPWPFSAANGNVPGTVVRVSASSRRRTPRSRTTPSSSTQAGSWCPTISARRATTRSRATWSRTTSPTAASPSSATTPAASTPRAYLSLVQGASSTILITGNVVLSDGTTGEGGGILLAGAASYDNTITDNEVAGNGLAGVTIHEHGVDALSGDVISGNWFGTNDITGDPGTPDQVTTGVFIERDPRSSRPSTSP